ncbi:hypothetical protein DIPPA_09707 [Diplonema papillatum]|nr:hypothetical protein DIPPA_09707 [Diplonema papillatum]
MTKAGVAAVIRAHKWAQNLRKGFTVADALQAFADKSGDFEAGFREPLRQMIIARHPPVRAVRVVMVNRLEEFEKLGVPAGAAGTAFAAAAFFRSWGQKVDLQLAAALVRVLKARYAAIAVRFQAGNRRGDGDITARAAMSSGDDSPLLCAQRIELLVRWMHEDRLAADPALFSDLLALCEKIAALGGAIRFDAALSSNSENRTYASWCLGLASSVTTALLQRFDPEGLKKPGPVYLSALSVYACALDFRRADGVLQALRRASGRADVNQLLVQSYIMLDNAAKTNCPFFPMLFARWGWRDANTARCIAVWYASGAGKGCPACGEASNHRRELYDLAAAPPRHADCFAKNYRTLYVRPGYIFLPRPETENYLEEAREITAFAERHNVTKRKHMLKTWKPRIFRHVLMMAVKAPPSGFDQLHRRLLDIGALEREDCLVPRLLHCMYQSREADLGLAVTEACQRGDVPTMDREMLLQAISYCSPSIASNLTRAFNSTFQRRR